MCVYNVYMCMCERLKTLKHLQQKRIFRVITRFFLDFYCEEEPLVSSKEAVNIIIETTIKNTS